MNCPSCDTPMIEETRYNVAIDRCQRCQGYWFDIDEIQKYFLSRGVQRGQWVPRTEELHTGDGGNARKCTCCGNRELREFNHRGVLFFSCSWCGGTFLPKSEFSKFKPSPPVYTEPTPQSSPIPPLDPSTPFDVFDIVLLVIEAVFHVVLD